MMHVTPEHTTRPLYHIAKTYGADYTDVLQVADGFKRQLRNQTPREAYYRPSLQRVMLAEKPEGHPSLFQAIANQQGAFTKLQDFGDAGSH